MCAYPKILESGPVQGNGRIRASTEKLFGRVPKNGRISVLPENGRIREGSEKSLNPGEYREMIESGRVLGKGRIRASIQKLFPRIPEMGRTYESTEKW